MDGQTDHIPASSKLVSRLHCPHLEVGHDGVVAPHGDVSGSRGGIDNRVYIARPAHELVLLLRQSQKADHRSGYDIADGLCLTGADHGLLFIKCGSNRTSAGGRDGELILERRSLWNRGSGNGLIDHSSQTGVMTPIIDRLRDSCLISSSPPVARCINIRRTLLIAIVDIVGRVLIDVVAAHVCHR